MVGFLVAVRKLERARRVGRGAIVLESLVVAKFLKSEREKSEKELINPMAPNGSLTWARE
jgi:hypothetical protein